MIFGPLCVNKGSANGQLLGWWFGFLDSPYKEKDCYLGVPRFEPQTTKRPKPTINHSLKGFQDQEPEVIRIPWSLK